jgi:hypothetical protein
MTASPIRILPALLLAWSALAAGAEDDAAKRALIVEIVAAQSIGEKALQSLVRESASPFREAIIDAELDVLGAGHGAGERWGADDPVRRRARSLVEARLAPVFANYESTLVAELGGGGSPDEPALQAWENAFSAEELAQIRDFEASPLGRKATLASYRALVTFSFFPVLTMFDNGPMEPALRARLRPALEAEQRKFALSADEEARLRAWLGSPVMQKVQQANNHQMARGHGGSAPAGLAKFGEFRTQLGAALEGAKSDVVPLITAAGTGGR